MSLEKKQKKVRAKGKRGRKPTSKILSLKTNDTKKSDNLIAHIPLFFLTTSTGKLSIRVSSSI